MLAHKLSKLKQLSDASIEGHEFSVGKHKLLAEIGRRQEKRNSEQLSAMENLRLFGMRVGRRLVPTHQRVVAFLVFITFLVSTNFIAQAAVPGDILYPLKLTFEKAELALAFSPASESRVHLRHVDKRLRELNVVVLKYDDRNNRDNISMLVRKIEQNITAAGNNLKVINDDKDNEESVTVTQLARDISQKANEAIDALQIQKIALSEPVTVTLTVDEIETSTDEVFIGPDGEKLEGTVQDVEQIITEVQVTNESISLLALRLMINLANEEGDDVEATDVMRSLIAKYRRDYGLLVNQTELITREYPVHKTDLTNILIDIKGLIDTANDLVLVHELTEAYFKLSEARELLVDAFAIESELINLKGFNKPDVDQEEEVVKPVIVPDIADVEVQVLPEGETLEDLVGELIEEVLEEPVFIIDGEEVEFNTETEKFGGGS